MITFFKKILCRIGLHDLEGCVCRRCGEVRHDFSMTREEWEETPGAWNSDFGGYDYIVRKYLECGRCGKRKFKGEWIVYD